MSFDWEDYLRLAKELAAEPANSALREARMRSATSRCYYAAFVLARGFAQHQDGLPLPSGRSVHWVVGQHFRNSSDPGRRAIGAGLRRLRASRNQADYDDILTSDLTRLAGGAVMEAEWLLRLLREL
jgi:uncharacterized protein (UPF0332 family)